MINTKGWLPPEYSWRALWLPQNIIPNSSLLNSIHPGHTLTLTGALLGSTVNGLEMRGAERITITDHADIHINDSLTVILPAFILATLFDSTAGADMGLMNLNNGAVIARLNSTTGALDFIFNDADGGVDETVSTTKVSWAAGTLWQVAFTFKFAPPGTISVRLYINGVAENTNDQCDQVITVPAGNTVLGEDLTTFFTGKFQRQFLVYDTTVLTEAQLLEIYKGIPYATNLKAYLPMDHPGRALTMPDRSTGGNCSGTISGTAIGAEIWDFAGHPKLTALSLDEINDYAVSPAALKMNDSWSVILVVKAGTTYNALSANHCFIYFRIIGTSNHLLLYFSQPDDAIRYRLTGDDGTADTIDYSGKPAIGDYLIFILTYDGTSAMQYFVNGSLVGTGTTSIIAGGLATLWLGSSNVPSEYEISKPLLLGQAEGALSISQARQTSRLIDKELGLGLGI